MKSSLTSRVTCSLNRKGAVSNLTDLLKISLVDLLVLSLESKQPFRVTCSVTCSLGAVLNSIDLLTNLLVDLLVLSLESKQPFRMTCSLKRKSAVLNSIDLLTI